MGFSGIPSDFYPRLSCSISKQDSPGYFFLFFFFFFAERACDLSRALREERREDLANSARERARGNEMIAQRLFEADEKTVKKKRKKKRRNRSCKIQLLPSVVLRRL